MQNSKAENIYILHEKVNVAFSLTKYNIYDILTNEQPVFIPKRDIVIGATLTGRRDVHFFCLKVENKHFLRNNQAISNILDLLHNLKNKFCRGRRPRRPAVFNSPSRNFKTQCWRISTARRGRRALHFISRSHVGGLLYSGIASSSFA